MAIRCCPTQPLAKTTPIHLDFCDTQYYHGLSRRNLATYVAREISHARRGQHRSFPAVSILGGVEGQHRNTCLVKKQKNQVGYGDEAHGLNPI